jgi:hypothetical protein
MDAERMAEIAKPYATVADRIRALDAAGAARADIARFLGKRYQHVRNVLEGDAQRGGGYTLGRADLSGVREEPARFDQADESRWIERRSPGAYWLRVRPDGTLPLPAELADALGAAPDKRVFAEYADGSLTIISGEAAHEKARAIVRKYIPADVDLVETFLESRRAAAAAEEAEATRRG